ncbi:NAD(P)/FAD-dependent oxidoreductase [Synechococcus sp. M16CYN]
MVIVGGGFGGLFSSLAVHRQLPDCPVVLIEPRKQFLFQPLLYELLSNELQEWEVAPRYSQLVSNKGICWLRDRVIGIDRLTHTLQTLSGDRIPWGQLVIATGSKPNDFGIPGVREHGSGFCNLSDVRYLRQLVQGFHRRRHPNAALAIVGAGSTGVELSCKLADLLEGKARIHLIEMGDSILPNSSAFNRERANAALERKDVIIHLNTSVTRVEANRVVLREDDAIAHQGLVWTAGNQPDFPCLQPPPSIIRGRLAVDGDLRLQGSTDIFAIGDTAITIDHPVPATAQVAMQQGEAVGEAIATLRIGEKPPMFQFNDRGEMLSLGIGDATLTGLGITMAGPLAFQLRRAAYLTRMPALSVGVRSAAAWLINR